MNIYQENLLDHYKNPRNFGRPSWPYNHSKKLQNLSCGDEIEFFFEVNNNKIVNISFIGEGCSISIGSASILSEYLIGKDIGELSKLTNDYLISELLQIELTPSRQNCATLPLECITEAVNK